MCGSRVAPRRGVQRGFSLVETIIATSLLATALVALAQFVGAGVQSGAAARTRAITTLLAEQKMEQLRALPWIAIAALPATTEYLDASGVVRCPGATTPCGAAVYVRRSASRPAFSSGVLFLEIDVSPVGEGHGRAMLVTARGRMTP